MRTVSAGSSRKPKPHRFPFESSQVPLFNLLGTATDQKRHAVFGGGHIPPRTDTIREVLNWLDRYLGPVTMK